MLRLLNVLRVFRILRMRRLKRTVSLSPRSSYRTFILAFAVKKLASADTAFIVMEV